MQPEATNSATPTGTRKANRPFVGERIVLSLTLVRRGVEPVLMRRAGVTLLELVRAIFGLGALAEALQRVDGDHLALLREDALRKATRVLASERERALGSVAIASRARSSRAASALASVTFELDGACVPRGSA